MIKSLRRLVSISAGAMMLVAILLPLAGARALDNPELYTAISMRGATAFADEEDAYVFAYEGGTVSVTGAVEPTVENINWNYGDHEGPMLVFYTKSNTLTFMATPEGNNPVQASLDMDGERDQIELVDSAYTLSGLVPGSEKHYDIEFMFGDGGHPEPQGNTEAVVTMHGGPGSYVRRIYDEDGNIVRTETFYYKDTYVEASFAINDGHFHQFQSNEAVEGEDYSRTTYYYNYDEESNPGTVDITFTTLWNWRLVNDVVTINGVDYGIGVDYEDQKSYLDHYAGQMVGFTVEGVTKADTYDIQLYAMQEPENAHTWIGNFLWTADPAQQYEKYCNWDELDENGDPICEVLLDEDGNPVPGRDYIGNSELALISVEYTVGNDTVGYTTYTCSLETVSCSWWASKEDGSLLTEDTEVETCGIEDEDCYIPYIEYDRGSAEFEDGSLVIPSGARVTMDVIPNYGYQVMNVNMAGLEVSDTGVGRFSFIVPEGAAYFVADVVEMEDTVNTETNLVSSGTIDLGDDQTTLEHGSAKLNVSDVELTEENIAKFEDAAGEYKIKNYLDISLYNITCKGATVCDGTDEDSWVERIHDLNEAATIVLQLEEGIDGNDIVIVHEKGDRTYEIIPTEYDPETHTITFTTTSFSNYAIASRTITSPDTGSATAEGASANESSFVTVVIATVAPAMIATVAVLWYNRRHDSKQR